MKRKTILIIIAGVLAAGVLLTVAATWKVPDHILLQREYPVHADSVWARVGDFGSVEGFGATDITYTFSGSGPGMTRTLTFPNGFTLTEQLESVDTAARRLVYVIKDAEGMPYSDYRAVLSAAVVSDTSCVLSEEASYCTSLLRKRTVRKMLTGFISAVFDNLMEQFAGP